jgi:hypothetical protein
VDNTGQSPLDRQKGMPKLTKVIRHMLSDTLNNFNKESRMHRLMQRLGLLPLSKKNMLSKWETIKWNLKFKTDHIVVISTTTTGSSVQFSNLLSSKPVIRLAFTSVGNTQHCIAFSAKGKSIRQ